MSLCNFPITDLHSIPQIDQAIKNLTTLISETVNNHTSTFVPSDLKYDLPTFIQSQISKKRKLRKLWQRTRDPNTKRKLNNQTTKVRDLLQAHRDYEWCNFLGSIDSSAQGWSKI